MEVEFVALHLICVVVVVVTLWLIARLAQSSCSNTKRGSFKEGIGEEKAGKEEKGEFEYDVFLNFRGDDTRNTFTGYLYNDLKNRGIRTFIDDEGLEKGHRINELFQYIEKSRIFVPIFSRGYADSKWCLMEVAKMVKLGRLILPVFFDVEPGVVRNQTASFQVSFKKHDSNTELSKATVKEWRETLRYVGELSGYVLQTETNGHGAKLNLIIIKKILQELNRTVFDVAEHPVGIDGRVEDVLKLLDMDCDDVIMVGIHGIGGIGKTTLTKSVFNRVSPSFEVSCYLSNVREVSKQIGGLVSLQKRIVSEASKDNNPVISDEDHGSMRIKELLQQRAILLVLDDVDDARQLKALAGGGHWFGPKSRIVVTSRFEYILANEHQRRRWNKQEIYTVPKLNGEESLELFTYHAFTSKKPLEEEYVLLSKEVVETTHGIPLILEVFGSIFFDKESPFDWRETLKELKQHQHKNVHDQLKISYDGLTFEEQQILLDITHFFIGRDREEAFYFWNGCHFLPQTSVPVLLHRSLIKINVYNQFEMHDEIKNMAREIVRQEALLKQIHRSRLTEKGDILSVLQYPDQGIKNVQGISLYIDGEEVDLEPSNLMRWDGLGAMTSLRLIQLFGPYHVDMQNIMGVAHLPSRLKWLQCTNYASDEHHSFLNLNELVVLKLRWGLFHDLPFNKFLQRFNKLKVLDLSHCTQLIGTPNFTYSPNLEKLVLEGCSNLCNVNKSIGCLKHLILLDMSECVSLTEIPSTLGNLTSLRKLLLDNTSINGLPDSVRHLSCLVNLSLQWCKSLQNLPETIGCLNNLVVLSMKGCESLEEIPDTVGNLTSLRELVLDKTRIEGLPDSIEQLTCLTSLSLQWCERLKRLPQGIGCLYNLVLLDMWLCHSLAEIPVTVGNLTSLRELRLNGTSIEGLPASTTQLTSLTILSLKDCWKLENLPEEVGWLSNLALLNLGGCKLLVELPLTLGCLNSLRDLVLDKTSVKGLPDSITQLTNLTNLSLEWCGRLEKLPKAIGCLTKLRTLNLAGSESLQEVPDSIGELKSLETLYLSKSCIKWLPYSSGNLKRLSKLDLSDSVSLQELPDSIGGLESLETLSLTRSKIRSVSASIASLQRLSQLNLSSSVMLQKIPNPIRSLKKLLKLNLGKCTSVERIPDWIGELGSLKTLILTGSKIRDVPDCVGQLERLHALDLSSSTLLEEITDKLGCLKKLRKLDLGGCESLEEVPESFGDLHSLESLSLSGTKIKRLPDSLRSLKKLREVDLSGCKSLECIPDSAGSFPASKHLTFNSCESLRCIPVSAIINLEKLSLKNCKLLEELPSSIGSLSRLKKLSLKDCSSLQSIPQLPSTLKYLMVWRCSSLKLVSDVSNLTSLKTFGMSDCIALVDIPGLQNLTSLQSLWLHDIGQLSNHHHLIERLSQATYKGLDRFELKISCVNETGKDLLFGFPRCPMVEGWMKWQLWPSDVQDCNTPTGIQIQVLLEGSDNNNVFDIKPGHDRFIMENTFSINFDEMDTEMRGKMLGDGGKLLKVSTTIPLSYFSMTVYSK